LESGDFIKRLSTERLTFRTRRWIGIAAMHVGLIGLAVANADEPEAQVRLVDLPGMHVVYVDYTGPYWSVGQELARVREEMTRSGAPGPLFARYLETQVADSPASRHIQLGFVVQPDASVPGNYQRAEWPATAAAVLALPRPPASLPRSAAVLADWVHANGYSKSQPLTEVYLQDGKDWTTSPVELRMAVQKTPPLAPATPQVPSDAQSDAESNVVTRTIQLRSHSAPSPAIPAPTPDTRDFRVSAQNDAPVTSADAPVAQATDSARPGATFGPKIIRPAPMTPSAVPVAEISVQPESTPGQTVLQLMSEGRFDDIAHRLMPARELVPPLRLWIGEMVGRADAAARGMRELHPTDAFALVATAEALNVQYEVWATDSDKSARLQPATPIGINRDVPQSARRLVRDMDILLARMAHRSLSPEDTQAQFAAVLQACIDLVESEPLPGTKTAP